MQEFDPRLEKILTQIKLRWQALSPSKRELVWNALSFAYSFSKRKSSKNGLTPSCSQSGGALSYPAYPDRQRRVSATAPSLHDWQELISRGYDSHDAIVDILVPVYDGLAETLRCIYSVLNTKTKIKFNLVVINDASPNAELTRTLRELAEQVNFEYIENEENLGFVATMNKGMLLHPDKDVVWLNSDTEVFDFWLDRMISISCKDKTIGTITPLSNNATICSYPKIHEDNFLPLEITDKELDNICSVVNKNTIVDSPTGVGFCMYVRREALNQAGLLNVKAFKRGYGEENDLCQRIHNVGFRNVLTSEIFVRHYGAVSFKKETIKRQADAEKELKKLHPNYDRDIQRWIAEDPLLISRIRIDCSRLKKQIPTSSTKSQSILHITHRKGGGTEHFVQHLIGQLKSQSIISYILRSDVQGTMSIETHSGFYPNLCQLSLDYSYTALKTILQTLQITQVHIHNLIDFDLSIIDLLREICANLGIPITVSLHDYGCCCPKLVLMQDSENCCTHYEINHCENCSKLWNTLSVWKLRSAYGRLFIAASKVIVPSHDMKDRLSKIFKHTTFLVVPHFDKGQDANTLVVAPDCYKIHEIQTIAIIGAISQIKGSHLVLKYATEIKEKKLPYRLVLIGYSDIDKELIKEGVVITGAYDSEKEVTTYLKLFATSAILIPSICAETYSYTTSIALRTGLPVFVFDIGAPSERLRSLGLDDYIIPMDIKMHSHKVLQYISKGISNPKKYLFTGNQTNLRPYYESEHYK